MAHPAALTEEEIESFDNFGGDIADAQLRKALWDGVAWLRQVSRDQLLQDELRQRALQLSNIRDIDLKRSGIEPWPTVPQS